jgi:hypothetical protein
MSVLFVDSALFLFHSLLSLRPPPDARQHRQDQRAEYNEAGRDWRTLTDAQRDDLQEWETNDPGTAIQCCGRSRTEQHAEREDEEIRHASKQEQVAARLCEQDGNRRAVNQEDDDPPEQRADELAEAIANAGRELWRVVAALSDVVVVTAIVTLNAERGQVVRAI